MSLPSVGDDETTEVPTVPTLAQVAAKLTKDSGAIADVYRAEVEDQAARCRVVPYRHALASAIYRRVQRSLAMEAVPLGVVVNEVGGTRVGYNDPEVRRLEGPYRKAGPIG